MAMSASGEIPCHCLQFLMKNLPMPKSAMTRRNILAAVAALSAGSVTARAALRDKTVVVIGAGLAGLSAARQLKASGATVVVVEARQRIGGRVWTSHHWPGMAMDLGASWIHGVESNPIAALAEEAGAARVATDYESSILIDGQGSTVDFEDELARAGDLVAAARADAENRQIDQSLMDAIVSTNAWREADVPTRRLLRHHVNGTVEMEYGGDWSEVSVWHFDNGKEFGGTDEIFPSGIGQITDYLAKGIDVRLGRTVTHLEPRNAGIRIRLQDGSTLEADHAIITVPLGVLQSGTIAFAQPLAPERQNAINALRMGLLNKCWLRFERVAWPPNVDWIEWLGPKDGYWSQWVSLAQAVKLPVLLGFNAGTQAREMEKLDDRATAASAHEALKSMFGSSFPAPVSAQTTRWSQDAFSRGSYSFNAVGVTPATRRRLAGPDWNGRLVFAGEAASADYFGTAHGAVLSGLAAAENLKKR